MALQKWLLHTVSDKYYIIDDNAYTLNNQMLIPFSGAAKYSTLQQDIQPLSLPTLYPDQNGIWLSYNKVVDLQAQHGLLFGQE